MRAAALACAVGLALLEGAASAQAPAGLRKPDGHPDLEGNWTNASITTLERADRYKSLVLKPEEVEMATKAHPQNVRQTTDDGQKLADGVAALNGKDLAQGRGYNAFWIDPGTRFGVVKGETRTSWIIDPADGKMPFSPEGKKLAAEAKAKLGYDGPEQRPLADQCMATGGRTGPPMINGLYNNNYAIVQAPGFVMIRTEMINHARVIPLTDQHGPAALHPLFGDSIAHWEGDALVIETTNFAPVRALQDLPAYLSEKAKVTERFSRVSKDELLYEFTVEDPVFYSRAWKGEEQWRVQKEPLYEYACHEGNYAMSGILRGARVLEAKGVKLQAGNEE